ncbi:ferritin [Candidatus Bipolaricaulota bacterium]|nr:ferritin [Candidatus Bipolaricaulota bacterium]
MIGKRMEEALNRQINEELFSAYLYLSMAAYFYDQGWDGMARWMELQSKEEVEHAMKIFHHLVERGGRVSLDALKRPEAEWGSPLDAFKAAYEHERYITGKIDELVALAREEEDNAAFQMLQWFVAEQVEEEDQTRKAVELLERVGPDGRGILMIDQKLGARAG